MSESQDTTIRSVRRSIVNSYKEALRIELNSWKISFPDVTFAVHICPELQHLGVHEMMRKGEQESFTRRSRGWEILSRYAKDSKYGPLITSLSDSTYAQVTACTATEQETAREDMFKKANTLKAAFDADGLTDAADAVRDYELLELYCLAMVELHDEIATTAGEAPCSEE